MPQNGIPNDNEKKNEITWGDLKFENIYNSILQDEHYLNNPTISKNNLAEFLKNQASQISKQKFQYILLSNSNDEELTDKFFELSTIPNLTPNTIIKIRNNTYNLIVDLRSLADCSDCCKNVSSKDNSMITEDYTAMKRISDFARNFNRKYYYKLSNYTYASPQAPFFFEKDAQIAEIIQNLLTDSEMFCDLLSYENREKYANRGREDLKTIIATYEENDFDSSLDYLISTINFAKKYSHNNLTYCNAQENLIKAIKKIWKSIKNYKTIYSGENK